MCMKRQTSRMIPAALAAVLVLGACGAEGDDATPEPPAEQPDGLRAPTPIEFTSGSGSGDRVAATASDAAVASDESMMIAPYFDVEYVLGDGLTVPGDDTGYVFDAAGTLSVDEITRLASALGVEGEPVRVENEYANSWRVGPEDGSAPSLWVADDAQQYWNYSSAWAEQEGVARVACAVSVDSEGNESVEECPEPEPPVGVPSAEQAEARVRDLLTAIGVDPASVEFDTYADEWSAGVNVTDRSDPRGDLLNWSFGFGADGVMQYASGLLATPEPVGPYPLIDLDTAFQRLQDQTYGGFVGGPAIDTPAIAIAEPAPDMIESGEPAAEPMPIDGTVPEPETITVTLTSVEPDLWWAWDVDGTVWLLPAYRFIGDDGGWYTVPAVTDEYLIQVEQPVVIDEPLPLEPGEPGVVEPGDPVEPTPAPLVDPAELAQLVGMPIGDFAAKAEAGGWTVRVVERDGEALAVTDDYSETRVNVAVVTVDGVEQVVRATLDDGTVVAEITIEPLVEPGTAPTDPTESAAIPVVGVFEGVMFYPACGDEQLTFDGTTWYQVQESDYPDIYATAVTAEREQAPVGVNGFARVVAPGPGDDVGTLVVWADGVARFVSDSGNLTAWLVDDELTYNWTC